jgi:hypothetical protein
MDAAAAVRLTLPKLRVRRQRHSKGPSLGPITAQSLKYVTIVEPAAFTFFTKITCTGGGVGRGGRAGGISAPP